MYVRVFVVTRDSFRNTTLVIILIGALYMFLVALKLMGDRYVHTQSALDGRRDRRLTHSLTDWWRGGCTSPTRIRLCVCV